MSFDWDSNGNVCLNPVIFSNYLVGLLCNETILFNYNKVITLVYSRPITLLFYIVSETSMLRNHYLAIFLGPKFAILLQFNNLLASFLIDTRLVP